MIPNEMVARLIIPASWCLIHQVELHDDRWDEQAAAFEFEQLVSVDLEKLTESLLKPRLW